jgi:hypothetical protein
MGVLLDFTGRVSLRTIERAQAMDQFCAAVENSAVEVVRAIPITAMKANGHTDAEVEARAVEARRAALEIKTKK